MRNRFCVAAPMVAAMALVGALAPARGQIIVSANDGKIVRPEDPFQQPVPDTVSVLQIKDGKLKVLGSVAASASMTGPAVSAAVARNGGFAIVTGCQKLQGGKLVPDDVVSVIDLAKPTAPVVLQTLHAGEGATGVSISPNGKLALVANSADDTVSVFSISGKTLTPQGTVAVEAKSYPVDVVFSNDGASAVVLGRNNAKIMILSVDGTHVANTGTAWSPGKTPYAAAVMRNSDNILTVNLGGAITTASVPVPRAAPGAPRGQAPRAPATITMTNIKTGSTAATVEILPVPEDIVLSPDGKFLAAVASNGIPNSPSDPNFKTVFGKLKVFAIGPNSITPVSEIDTGHWCQGAIFSGDGKTILVQCSAEKEIEVFHFDGTGLTRDASATLFVGARPGAIASALSR
jgi:DNA-binding beta-propeller fold protein YncE